jgi:hypothetical protein
MLPVNLPLEGVCLQGCMWVCPTAGIEFILLTYYSLTIAVGMLCCGCSSRMFGIADLLFYRLLIVCCKGIRWLNQKQRGCASAARR